MVVQTPEMAQFDGMPKAAIDTGCADIVIDAKAIGATLDRFVHGRKLMTAVGGAGRSSRPNAANFRIASR